MLGRLGLYSPDESKIGWFSYQNYISGIEVYRLVPNAIQLDCNSVLICS